MSNSRNSCLLVAMACLLLAAASATALVDPSLQPSHLIERYKAAIVGQVTKVDDEARTVTFRVTQVCLGQFEPKEVTVRVPPAAADESDGAGDAGDGEELSPEEFLREAKEGETVVAFVGLSRKKRENATLIYLGQGFHDGEMPDPSKPSAWTWTEAHGDKMKGAFFGEAAQFAAMIRDAAEGAYYFPAIPFTRFKDEVEIAKLPSAVGGVALYDIDGDGDLDIYACCDAGNRAFLQTAPGKFEDSTAAMGLDKIASASCDFADVNGDGRADLLADGTIYLGGEKGFVAADLLPRQPAKVKCAAFVDVSGDGYPDVIVSRVDGGLALYLNPGAKGGAFADATASAGLDGEACGAGGTGFFAPGDFNGDGRTDLFYAIDSGLFLAQDAKGRFAPVKHAVPLEFKVPGKGPGLTGGGCFAPQWLPDSTDLAVANESAVMVAHSRNGIPVNVSGAGNELMVASVGQVATLAEDLNMDGYVDLFTITREGPNSFHTNRGYGSYMVDDLYATGQVFPKNAYETGALGAAAGDVDGDGATDLLLGGADGCVRLVVSDCLADRKPTEHPTLQEQALQQTAILTVKVRRQLGVVGAAVELTDAKGRVYTRRTIGTQVLTGCRGADTVNIAVRRPGRYVLSVRYSDGQTDRWNVDLGSEKRLIIDTRADLGKRLAATAPATQPK